MAEASESKRGNLPPYISFKTFLSFVQKLKDTTVPGRVDGSVLRNYAGSVARQLVTGLKFLKLLESNGNTTDRLKKLVTAYGTAGWKELLGQTIHESYSPAVGDLDLENGTHQQLVEAFREAGTDGVVLDRAISFYLSALREAEQTFSPHFANRVRRPRGEKGRTKRKEKTGSIDAVDEDDILDQAIPADEMTKFNLAIPGKHSATIILPIDLSTDDWEMISDMVKLYVARLEKANQ
jgi:hypothetical protein